MRLPNIGGLATMLGLGVQGYGQDEATDLARKRQAAQDLLAQQKFGMEQQLGQAQIGNFASESAQRTAATANANAATAAKSGANQKAFGMIKAMNPNHPMVQSGFDPDTDYTEEAKGVVGAWRDAQKPKPPPKRVYDSARGAVVDEEAGTAAPVQGLPAKPAAETTPYQSEMMKIAQQRLKMQQDALANKANQQTPDQLKSKTVYDLAAPAADIVSNYYAKGGAQGAAPMLSGALSHIPVFGGKLSNISKGEQDYQDALTASRTLATQYLEILPKSRFQPSTVDDIMQQIAPEPGKDSNPQLRAQKAARVTTLKKAIAARAKLRPDAPDITLDDAPDPPGGVP